MAKHPTPTADDSKDKDKDDAPAKSFATSSGHQDPNEQPPAQEQPPKELNRDTDVTNTPNPALPADTDVGTLENPKNTGSGDTPNGIEGAVPTIGTGPYPKDGTLPTQEELPETPSEA